MFWPLVLPVQITFGLIIAFVLLATAFAPAMKWKRANTFGISSLIGCLAFIPSCACIITVIDAQRFGVFQFDAYSDVGDFRIERYLPTNAKNITLEKHASGHRAKYSISKSELADFLDGLWHDHGQFSAISRDDLHDGEFITPDAFDFMFADLGWPPFNGIEFHSPVQGDGGGATYYFDPATGTAYHRAGYW
jgi:hypothetical protein